MAVFFPKFASPSSRDSTASIPPPSAASVSPVSSDSITEEAKVDATCAREGLGVRLPHKIRQIPRVVNASGIVPDLDSSSSDTSDTDEGSSSSSSGPYVHSAGDSFVSGLLTHLASNPNLYKVDKEEVRLRGTIGVKKDEYFLDGKHVTWSAVYNFKQKCI